MIRGGGIGKGDYLPYLICCVEIFCFIIRWAWFQYLPSFMDGFVYLLMSINHGSPFKDEWDENMMHRREKNMKKEDSMRERGWLWGIKNERDIRWWLIFCPSSLNNSSFLSPRTFSHLAKYNSISLSASTPHCSLVLAFSSMKYSCCSRSLMSSTILL